MANASDLIGKKTVVVRRSKNKSDDQALIITMIAAGYTCHPARTTIRFERIDQKPPRINK